MNSEEFFSKIKDLDLESFLDENDGETRFRYSDGKVFKGQVWSPAVREELVSLHGIGAEEIECEMWKALYTSLYLQHMVIARRIPFQTAVVQVQEELKDLR